MQVTSVKHLTNEHSEWRSSLGFYKDELVVYKNRLTEIAGKNTANETMQQVEHFQNQFVLHIEAIDTLNHDINGHLNGMADAMKEHAGHVTQEQLAEHARLKERFETEDKMFVELKHEFTQFSAKWM
jgi:ribosomal protein L10